MWYTWSITCMRCNKIYTDTQLQCRWMSLVFFSWLNLKLRKLFHWKLIMFQVKRERNIIFFVRFDGTALVLEEDEKGKLSLLWIICKILWIEFQNELRFWTTAIVFSRFPHLNDFDFFLLRTCFTLEFECQKFRFHLILGK